MKRENEDIFFRFMCTTFAVKKKLTTATAEISSLNSVIVICNEKLCAQKNVHTCYDLSFVFFVLYKNVFHLFWSIFTSFSVYAPV